MLMLAVIFALVIAHLSLYPYSGWRHIGIGPFEYLSGPWIPIHQTLLWGDIVLNVIAYIPLGFLLLLGLSELPKNAERLIAPGLAIALSFGLEAMQTSLPTRVPSKMDVLTNSMGAIAGSALAIWVVQHRDWANRLNSTLRLWLIQKAWLGIGLLCLWMIAILAPRQPEFMLGVWLGNLFDPSLLMRDGSLFGLPSWLVFEAEIWVPKIGNYCFLLAVLLIGLMQTRTDSPRIRLLVTLAVICVLVTHGHIWVNEGFDRWTQAIYVFLLKNYWSVLPALLLAVLASLFKLKTRSLAALAFAHLLLGWGLTLFLPGIYPPEISQSGYGWIKAFRDLQQAGRWLSEVWPLLGLLVLIILGTEKQQFRR